MTFVKTRTSVFKNLAPNMVPITLKQPSSDDGCICICTVQYGSIWLLKLLANVTEEF